VDQRAQHPTWAAYLGLGWVVLFFAFHVYWYLGGSFASPGDLPDAPHAMIAWIFSTIVSVAFPLGALVCLAIARGWARGRLAPAVKALVWVGCVVLLLRGGAGILDDLTRATGLLRNGITGLSLKDTTGHAHLRWSDWAIDAYFLAGGIIFWVLAVRHRAAQNRARRRSARGSAEHLWGRNEHVDVIESSQKEVLSEDAPAFKPLAQVPVPPWAERLAHVIPFLVLPSGLWRLAVAFGFPMGMVNDAGELVVQRGWPAVYIAAISILSEAVALTALGLVRPWGEVAPPWLPFIGGRPVRPKAAIVPATLGSIALMLIWTVGFWDVWTRDQASTMASPFWAAVFAGCYAPLNLWGPALLTLTWAYHRRRRGPIPDRGQASARSGCSSAAGQASRSGQRSEPGTARSAGIPGPPRVR
jgi:hypothetical protein